MKVEVTVRGIGQSYKDKIVFESSNRNDGGIWMVVDGKRYNFGAGTIIRAIEACKQTVFVPLGT